MKVTKVNFKAVSSSDTPNVLGYADITLEGQLVIKSIRVIMGKYGPFLSFPSRKGEDDNYYDIVFPLNKKLRSTMTEAVLKEGNLLKKSLSEDEKKDDGDFWGN